MAKAKHKYAICIDLKDSSEEVLRSQFFTTEDAADAWYRKLTRIDPQYEPVLVRYRYNENGELEAEEDVHVY